MTSTASMRQMKTMKPEYLFSFVWDYEYYSIFRLPNGRYRFAPAYGNVYTVQSWKNEILHITKGRVRYR